MKRPSFNNLPDYSIDNPDFTRRRKNLTWIFLLVSAAIVFVSEVLLIFTLNTFTNLPDGWIIFLDGIFLVVILYPLNYLFMIRPLVRQFEERTTTNSALLKSQEIFEHFFSVSDILIAYMDNKFNFIRVNQAYADADDRKAEDFIGKNHFELYPSDDNLQIFQAVVDSGKPFTIIDKPFAYADAPERGLSYWDWNLFPIKNPKGLVIELLMILTNVTERHNNLLAIAEKDRQFRAVFDQTYHFNFLTDAEGVVMMINRSGLDFLQRPPEELFGKHIWELPNLLPDTEKPLRESLNEAIGGKVVRRPLKVRYSNGEPCTLEAAAKAIVNAEGKAELFLFEALDITRIVNSEEALRENELKLEQLYNTEKEARRSADLLRNAVLALANSPDIDSIFENLLNYVHQKRPYELAHIFLFDEDNMLNINHVRGEELLPENERLLGKSIAPEELSTILAPLFERHKIIHVDDAGKYPSANVLFPSFPLGSWIAFPLIVGTEMIGVCVFGHRQKCYFSPEFEEWTYTIVNQSAISIQNHLLFEQVSESRERLQALARRLVEVQEKERRYVAQELHDETGQALASIRVGLMLLERESADSEAVVKRCHELNDVTKEVLENLHRLSMDLRPAALDHLGLVPALRQQIEILGEQHGIDMRFDTIGEMGRLPSGTETAIYRIVQEALTNVIKHSHATHVDVMFEKRNADLLIVVEDNGIGFTPNVMATDHLGTMGMSERALSVGGSVRIESSPGEGTAVFLEVPCPSES